MWNDSGFNFVIFDDDERAGRSFMKKFDDARERLEAQYLDVKYDPSSGLSKEELKAEFLDKLDNITGVEILPHHSFARSKYAAVGLLDTMPRVKSPSENELNTAKNFFTRSFRAAVN